MLLAASTIIEKPINVGETAVELRLSKLMNTYNPFTVALYSVEGEDAQVRSDFSADRLSPAPLGVVQQQSAERLRRIIDYSDWLGSASLQSVSVSISPSGDATPLVVSSSLGSESRTVELLVSDGVTGTSYSVSISVTTDDNQVREDELIVVVIA